ncbi:MULTISPECIES: YwqG family protein [Nocardiopsis]|uniref:DUF1963 domain-containing protein n=1 Tax=Nocardiopsis sinuspersici TaxID=501010 RepID=A0A1V3C3P5_9ACTN|nr:MULTISPECIES: DUF1963 domain-containing protein [Nocardiopsis]OOC55089.1 DUF1963 domain-containing protein [Nocardiopsis sinuspersici]
MTRHTPPRPVDVEALFPELRPLRREAVRLHPRAGRPSCRDSSVGGPLLWPADEPWPVCGEEHYEADSNTLHEGEVHLVPIVQVHQADAPGIAFPRGRDLLQVLWCPYDHGEFRYPLPRVHWRSAHAVGRVGATPSPHPEAPECYVPAPCVVHPEQVTEYPRWDLPKDLSDALEDRFAQLEGETGWLYPYHLAEAPGIKLGGYPGWTQQPVWPECGGCGQRMDHLLTVASWEYDGESWRTWLPVEDRAVVDGEESWRSERGRAAQDSAGLMLGDVGGVYVFECRSCPGRPVGHWFDCS